MTPHQNSILLHRACRRGFTHCFCHNFVFLTLTPQILRCRSSVPSPRTDPGPAQDAEQFRLRVSNALQNLPTRLLVDALICHSSCLDIIMMTLCDH